MSRTQIGSPRKLIPMNSELLRRLVADNVLKGSEYPDYDIKVNDPNLPLIINGSISVIPDKNSEVAFRWSTFDHSLMIVDIFGAMNIHGCVIPRLELSCSCYTVSVSGGTEILGDFHIRGCDANELIVTDTTVGDDLCIDGVNAKTIIIKRTKIGGMLVIYNISGCQDIIIDGTVKAKKIVFGGEVTTGQMKLIIGALKMSFELI